MLVFITRVLKFTATIFKKKEFMNITFIYIFISFILIPSKVTVNEKQTKSRDEGSKRYHQVSEDSHKEID